MYAAWYLFETSTHNGPSVLSNGLLYIMDEVSDLMTA